MNDLNRHFEPKNFSDKVALSFTKFLRFLADTFSKKDLALVNSKGFTYLNPHVYSDTVFFLGNFSKSFILNQKILFGIGASIASLLFFFTIGYLSKYLSQYAQSLKVWKTINIFIISFMSLLTIFVIMETIN